MSRKRIQQAKDDLRERILAAAAELIAEEGVQRLTLRKLAARIDYTPTTIYLYFKDKADLLSQVAGIGADDFAARLAELAARHEADPLAHLAAFARLFLAAGIDNARVYQAIFAADLGGANNQGRLLDEFFAAQPHFRYAADVVRRGTAAGVFRAVDPVEAVRALWAASHGLILACAAHDDLPRERKLALAETLLECLFGGLAAPGTAETWRNT